MLAAVGEQSDKPLVSTFLASEGIPELLRVPDVAGSTAGRGSVPSYPAVEAAVRALARVVEYAAWRAKPLGELVAPDSVDTMAARPLVSQILSADDRGRDLTFDELHDAARGLRHRPVGPRRGGHRRRGGRRGRAAGATTSCSRPPPSTCASVPTSRTSGATSTPRPRCATPGSRCRSSMDNPGAAGFIVQRVAAPGRAGVARRHGGPAVRAGGVLRRVRAGDRAARGPVLPDPADAQRRRQRHGPGDPGRAAAVRLPGQRGGRRRRDRAPAAARSPS